MIYSKCGWHQATGRGPSLNKEEEEKTIWMLAFSFPLLPVLLGREWEATTQRPWHGGLLAAVFSPFVMHRTVPTLWAQITLSSFQLLPVRLFDHSKEKDKSYSFPFQFWRLRPSCISTPPTICLCKTHPAHRQKDGRLFSNLPVSPDDTTSVLCFCSAFNLPQTSPL